MGEIIRIPNIDQYTQEIINGELILRPKKKYITENDLNMTLITNSKIKECLIKNGNKIITIKKKYRRILIDIWKSIPTQKILQTTTYNFKLTKEIGERGYNWCDDIKMSFQDKDAKGTLKEIINMVKVNKFTIELSFESKTGKIIKLQM